MVIHDSYDQGTEGSAPTYKPLYYAISEVNVTGSGTLADPMKGLDYGPILEYSDDLKTDIAFQIEGSQLVVPDVPLVRRQIHHHASNPY